MNTRHLFRALALSSVAATALLACVAAPSNVPKRVTPSETPQRSPQAASVGDAPGFPVAHESVPFLKDDWAAARAEAKRRNVPIFVDAWATWCHSCQSMRAFVLTDPSLAQLANDFVWLSIDTGKSSNTAFVARYSNAVWPTLWVIDVTKGPDDVILRWEGTATADELRTLLGSVKAGGDAATLMFVRASHEAARGELSTAESTYRTVLASAPLTHPHRGRAVEALIGLLATRGDYVACTELAVAEVEKLDAGTSRAVVLATGLSCARQAERREDSARLVAAAVATVTTDGDARTLADDRSSLFEELIETKKHNGDTAGARDLARRWSAYLEGAAAKAPTKQARAVFDPHRLNAYLALGDPSRAIPMLAQSERDFPDDYNPPARLARTFLELQRLEEATAAIDRASERVYGPRGLRVFALAADIAEARQDRKRARYALEQALVRTEGAVLSASQRKQREALRIRLASLTK